MNLQLDHFPMIFSNKHKKKPSFGVRAARILKYNKNIHFLPLERPHKLRAFGARLSQRVAMDDLASYFVEERSKVR